ncbi:MAG: Glycosyltransferases, probably involved in cell wall biogenesis [uncultured Sphingosinicella sp.]|uniref:Glycosyltransferases, probably involved in cell wall biogenesis n=1 Tax=uncultured Sphingosinicella sp. TaxID=478748 RepID=A0A6J4U8Q1_9SPHN|nr:glycosyl transferase family protein [uncultured Sphingosinicella sp.]CAA9541183.1 MAG: Glycosyltransferases, probably involved in cell wall biogenesis [uncultured Sphingosinicella sp.]
MDVLASESGVMFDVAEPFFAVLGYFMHETLLFAASGFLLLGLSDLAVDAIWIRRTARHRLRPGAMLRADSLPEARSPGLIAVFVPAWDESAVIGDMLRNSLETFGDGEYLIFVGAYPNDPATIAAVRSVDDRRVRLIVGPVPGGTTKADCLNGLWLGLLEEERRVGRQAKAVVLQDAEDVVHSAELRIFDRLVEEYDLVQLPVLPLVEDASWVSTSYADEFAEAHGKELVVRQALGASIPSAGVGCAFSRAGLQMMAAKNGGLPFEADSLTEDYELGLKLHAYGAKAAFVRLRACKGGAVVATKEYFPGSVQAAVNQKARWMTGIALSGWDRLGWSGGFAERWMRLRDRQSVLAAILLCAAYLTLLLWGVLQTRALIMGVPLPEVSEALQLLLNVNLAMLGWRLAVRFAFVTRAYGWAQGLRSIPRVLVSNLISMWAAQRAIYRYLAIRRSGTTVWGKTAHRFPIQVPAE